MGIFVKRRVCVESQRLCECSSHRPSDGCGLGNCALKYKSVLKVGVSVSVAGGGDEGGCWWWGTRLTPLKSGATTPPILGSIPPFVAGRRALSKSFLLKVFLQLIVSQGALFDNEDAMIVRQLAWQSDNVVLGRQEGALIVLLRE